MYSMSPEDTLRQVMRYQNEQRERMARERQSASSGRTMAGPQARTANVSRARQIWLATRRRLNALTGRHGVAREGVVR
jgi:hypothetical protein